jgi:uncharacterized membrane protein YbjE (DUF340 family)
MPFIAGALIRLFNQKGIFSAEIFDPATLYFSMAMLCLLVAISSRKLQDRNLADSVSSHFTAGMTIFIVLFTVTALYAVEDDTSIFHSLNNIGEGLRTRTVGPDDAIKMVNQVIAATHRGVIGALRNFAFALSIVTVIAAGLCKYRYKLED